MHKKYVFLMFLFSILRFSHNRIDRNIDASFPTLVAQDQCFSSINYVSWK